MHTAVDNQRLQQVRFLGTWDGPAQGRPNYVAHVCVCCVCVCRVCVCERVRERVCASVRCASVRRVRVCGCAGVSMVRACVRARVLKQASGSIHEKNPLSSTPPQTSRHPVLV